MTMLELPAPPQNNCIRIVLIGDTVGKPGMRIACAAVPWLRQELQATCLIVNAENAADGSGLCAKDYRRLMQAGFNGITLGDHLYRKKEIIETLEAESNIVRPCNLPPAAAGKTQIVLTVGDGVQVGVVSALGRVFMKPIDCPFHAVNRELAAMPDAVKIRLVDFHAEATSDKQLMGRYLDGRVTAVLGTHTHVTTADEQIFPGGTGFHCDVGMTGPFESIIGRRIDAVLHATLTAMPTSFHIATEDVRLSATWFDARLNDGKCQQIGRLSLTQATLDQYAADQAALRLRL